MSEIDRAEGVASELPTCDAVIIEDYGKGTLAPEVLTCALSRAGEIPVVVDPNGADWSRYRGATLITPNVREVELAARGEARDLDELVALARTLIEQSEVRAIAITRGAEGMTVVTRDAAESVPTAPVEVYDVTGAGDAVAAVFALGLAGGLELVEAAAVANVAGGAVVRQVGVGHLSREELVRAPEGGARGVATVEEASRAARRIKAEGRRVVFTNGCFDLLHHGHVKLLEEARRHGDFLIVGINSDESVSRIKGPGRPILRQEQRSRVLGALSSVDLVVVFGDEEDEDKPLRLIKAIRPDCLVKGGEYEESRIVGAKFVRGYGGEVVRVPLVEGVSTSSIVGRMKETDGAERPLRCEWSDE